jgi:hypothetical protein
VRATGEYEDSEEVLTDVAQVWANCLLYNPPEHPISQWAHELSAYTTKLVDENEKKRKSEEESDLKRKAFVYPSPISKKDVQAKVSTTALPSLSPTKALALTALSILSHARTQRKKLEDMSDGSYPEHQTQEEKWVEKYEQLKDFRDRFGHCRVPKMWDENLALGTWVYVLLARLVSCACAALPLTTCGADMRCGSTRERGSCRRSARKSWRTSTSRGESTRAVTTSSSSTRSPNPSVVTAR